MSQLMDVLWVKRLLTVHSEDFNVKNSGISVLFWHNRTKIQKLCCYIMVYHHDIISDIHDNTVYKLSWRTVEM